MDFDLVQRLYDAARDAATSPAKRQAIERELAAMEDEVVAACLELPLATGLKNQKFESYSVVYARNCLDSPFVRHPATGRMSQDHTGLPPEHDRIGNVLMAVARNKKEHTTI